MRKKATYWGLGLSLAIGLTATAASGWLPGTASLGAAVQSVLAAEEGDGDEETPPVDSELRVPISITPADGAKIGTNRNVSSATLEFKRTVSVNRASGREIIVKKDGVEVQRLAASDMDAIKLDPKSSYNIILNFKPLDTAGIYSFEVPAEIFDCETQDASSGTLPSLEFSFSYEVLYTRNFSVVPASGTQLAKIDTDDKFLLTVQDTNTIEINKDIAEPETPSKGARIDFINGNKTTFGTSVTLKVEDGKIAVIPDNAQTTICTKNTMYYKVVIPAGSLIINGEPYQTAIEWQYSIVNLPQGFVKPSIEPSNNYLNSVNDFDSFTVDLANFGEGWTITTSSFLVKNAAQLVSYNPETGVYGTSNYATYTVSMVEGTTLALFKRNEPASPTVELNNPGNWPRGAYALKLAGSVFLNGSKKNDLMYFAPYYLPGITTFSYASVTPETGLINPEVGLGAITLTFTVNSEPTDKLIKVYKKGSEAAPIYTFSADNVKYVTKLNNGRTINIKFPTIKDQGEYVVEFEDGCFRQTAGGMLPSGNMKLDYTVPEPINHTVTPAPGYVNELDEIKLTFTDATGLTLLKPEAIHLLGGTSGTNVMTGFDMTPSVEGNVLTLKLEKPEVAKGANPYLVNIPVGIVKMTVGGKEVINPGYNLVYRIDNMEKGSVIPADNSTVKVDQLGRIIYTPVLPEGVKITGFHKTAFPFLAPYKDDGTLNTSASAKVCQYKCELSEDGKQVILTNDSTFNLAATPSGAYGLRIANTVVTYEDSVGNVVKPLGPQDFPYEIDGYTETGVTLTNVPAHVEVLPKEYIFTADNGGTFSYFEKFVPVFYLQQGTSTSTRQELTATISEDGKTLTLSLSDEQYEKLTVKNGAPINLEGKEFRIYSKRDKEVTTPTEGMLTGQLKITDGDNVGINEGQKYQCIVDGANPDPFKEITPLSGPFMIENNPNGLESVTITTDSYTPIQINYDCKSNVTITKDGQLYELAPNVFDFESLGANSVMLYLTPAITEGGKYTIIFPRGMFKYGTLETPSNEFSIDYTVIGLETIAPATITPAEGTLISQFDGITLNFENIEIANVVKNGDIFYTVSNPLSTMPGMNMTLLEPVLNPDKKSILLTLSEEDENMLKQMGNWPIQDPGNYSINFSQNSLVITTTEGKKYGIVAGGATVELIPAVANTFAPTGYFAELKDMTVSFTGINNIEKYEFADASAVATLTKGTETYPVTVAIEGNKLLASVATPLTELGDYTLTIPAKTYVLTNEEGIRFFNREIKNTFKITAKPGVSSIYPTPDSKLSFLANVDIMFSVKPVINKNLDEPIVLKRNGETIMTLGRKSSQIKIGFGDDPDELCQLTFYTDKISSEPGRYTVEVPAGFFLLGGVPCDPITIKYKVVPAPDYNIYPAEQSAIESLPEVRIVFDGVKEIRDNHFQANYEDGGFARLVSLNNGDEIFRDEDSNRLGEVILEGNTMIIKTTNPENLSEGTWQLYIPQGAFSFLQPTGEDENGEVVDEWNPCPEYAFDWFKTAFNSPVIDPAPGKVTPTAFDGPLTVSLTDGSKFSMWLPSNAVVLYKNDKRKTEVTRWLYDYNTQGSAAGKTSVTLINTYGGSEPLTLEEGEYTLRIGRGTIMLETEPYPIDPEDPDGPTSTSYVSPVAYVYSYTVVDDGSVSSIFDSASSFNIYSIDGKVIKLDADTEFVNTLEPGLYIINGRRVIVKK